jgi:hypothetical protein
MLASDTVAENIFEVDISRSTAERNNSQWFRKGIFFVNIACVAIP